MSRPPLVQIPFEDGDDDNMSRDSSPSATYHHDKNGKSKSDRNENDGEHIIVIPCTSPPAVTFQQNLLSPSDTSKLHQFSTNTIGTGKDGNSVYFDNLVRIVSSKECSILRNNISHILSENSYDIKHQFNLSEFIQIFKKVFPSSQDDEITKLFNLLLPKNTKSLSFDFIINNDDNFNQFLECMGCITDEKETEQNHKPKKQSEIFLEFPTKPRETITPRYSPNVKREYNPNKPILSWRATASASASTQNNNSINHSNYTAYIEYQREIIETLRTEINNIYKPLLLQNKEMEINIESLTKEIEILSQENKTLINEINSLEQDLKYSRMDSKASTANINDELHEFNQILKRKISTSFVEIKQSHEYLEHELVELQQNLKSTKDESNKASVENNKLQTINHKYLTLNEKLRNKNNKLQNDLNISKMTIQNKNDEINTLKCDLFEKDQSLEILNNLCNDLSQQLQFHYKTQGNHNNNNNNSNNSKRKKMSKDFDLKIASIRSASSVNHGRFNSNNNIEFDIFNDMLLSPRKYSNYYSNMSAVTTPNHSVYGGNQTDHSTSKEHTVRSYEIFPNMDGNMDENKDDVIEILKTDLNELQKKYDKDMIESRIELERTLRIELEQEIRNSILDMNEERNLNDYEYEYDEGSVNDSKSTVKTVKTVKTRNIGTQTQVLGFWEKLLSDLQIRCIPIDEDDEW